MYLLVRVYLKRKFTSVPLRYILTCSGLCDVGLGVAPVTFFGSASILGFGIGVWPQSTFWWDILFIIMGLGFGCGSIYLLVK